MDFLLTLALVLALSFWMTKAKLQQQRIALLARFLSGFSIEKNIETLTEGYLRALGEADPGRREQVWNLLRTTEQALCTQMRQFANDFAAADAAATRVSKLPIWLPLASAFAGSFDMREALRVHARGICRAIDEEGAGSAKDRAFAISAEMLLMQHTCHWFCRSKTVASARMLARHRTSYEQLVGAVLPQTRSDYLGLVSLARRA
ncbi:hypothetical protein PE066_17225 [Ramlibacter tataouinensis]|uniref:hypothetical protein n=1 Tax=Ramlibacter tataouinensis TaxID=94132 RepID=UPI0022F38504|nr:hypothetical protein [Ramlibacter tataouinensis]WBY01185.1 hypothetical protein PE066_17225 [Ramlibacter tataouinensis]